MKENEENTYSSDKKEDCITEGIEKEHYSFKQFLEDLRMEQFETM